LKFNAIDHGTEMSNEIMVFSISNLLIDADFWGAFISCPHDLCNEMRN